MLVHAFPFSINSVFPSSDDKDTFLSVCQLAKLDSYSSHLYTQDVVEPWGRGDILNCTIFYICVVPE